MKISKDSIATLTYTLTSLSSGDIIEHIPEDTPATFSFNTNQLIPAFEKNLMGLSMGDHFDFTILADDAYGKKDPYAIFDIPIDTFEEKGKVNEKMLQIGNVIPMTDNKGNKHFGQIKKVMTDAVTLDFNHPLAGLDLRFTGNVTDVKENK